MPDPAVEPGPVGGVRLAEIVGVLSLGTDLGLGQPMEQGLRATLLAVRLGESLGLGADELADVFYLPTLRFVGCTADTLSVNHYFGDEFAAERDLVRLNGASQSELLRFIVTNVGAGRSPARRIGLVASALATARKQIEAADRAHCEVATLIAARLGFGERIRRGIAQAFERWDGKGDPGAARGEELEIALRISQVAYTVALLDALDGLNAALATARRRAGGGLDPGVGKALRSSCRAWPRAPRPIQSWWWLQKVTCAGMWQGTGVERAAAGHMKRRPHAVP